MAIVANERIARQVVQRIVDFRTAVPCGLTLTAFATRDEARRMAVNFARLPELKDNLKKSP